MQIDSVAEEIERRKSTDDMILFGGVGPLHFDVSLAGVAKAFGVHLTDGDINTSVESLRVIIEEEQDRRRSIRQRNLERYSQFSGTFTRLALDGSKTLFKGNLATVAGGNLIKVHKTPRGPQKELCGTMEACCC